MSAAAIAGLADASSRAVDGDATFAGYVAHELRTPLATQRPLLELALTDPDADVATWREIGEDVLDACRQQERLLEACLVLARSQNGLTRCERVDLGLIVSGLTRTRDLRGLNARTKLNRAVTIGDRDLIERLVDNLLGNAVRHNTVGGWIEVTTGRSRGKTLLTVANGGPRIPADEVARLFEPFQQLAGSKTGPEGGLGLGLTVANAVASAHDALISAHARASGGLRVEVAFPTANR